MTEAQEGAAKMKVDEFVRDDSRETGSLGIYYNAAKSHKRDFQEYGVCQDRGAASAYTRAFSPPPRATFIFFAALDSVWASLLLLFFCHCPQTARAKRNAVAAGY